MPTAVTDPVARPRTVHRRPGVRSGYTLNWAVGDMEGILIANAHPDGTLREVFVHVGKHGSTLAGLLEAWATTLSVGLRNRLPLQLYLDHLADTGFIPAGMTNDHDLPHARSVIDYLIRRLENDWLQT
jgi:ribonucleoside-diphosphate reductase alpha chain